MTADPSLPFTMADVSTLVTGVVFGAALTLSNVFQPSVITSQLRLESFHMLKVFLSATASSAIVIDVLGRFGIPKPQARSASSIGRFGLYDANILGGLLHGIGMAMTGACPGTVFVQLAAGIRSAFPTLAGGLVGGILFARYGNGLKRPNVSPESIKSEAETVASKFDLRADFVLWGFEILCFTIVGAPAFLSANDPGLVFSPVAGGLLIALAQASSLILNGRALGISTTYDELGRSFWHFVGTDKTNPRPPLRTTTLALGIMLGSLILTSAMSTRIHEPSIPAIQAFAGGSIMIFGARLAGGCTSGHGISGMSTFSIASIVTVASMFAGGIATALVPGLTLK